MWGKLGAQGFERRNEPNGVFRDNNPEQNGIIGNLRNSPRPLLATILISTLN
jgi:hypothetical protein